MTLTSPELYSNVHDNVTDMSLIACESLLSTQLLIEETKSLWIKTCYPSRVSLTSSPLNFWSNLSLRFCPWNSTRYFFTNQEIAEEKRCRESSENRMRQALTVDSQDDPDATISRVVKLDWWSTSVRLNTGKIHVCRTIHAALSWRVSKRKFWKILIWYDLKYVCARMTCPYDKRPPFLGESCLESVAVLLNLRTLTSNWLWHSHDFVGYHWNAQVLQNSFIFMFQIEKVALTFRTHLLPIPLASRLASRWSFKTGSIYRNEI